jgi:AcrR family transcriptional regulator
MPTSRAKGDNATRLTSKPGARRTDKPSTPAPQTYRDIEPVESAGKRRLLDAATIEFAERGFDGASVLAIARRAGVKQPLLNYHFGGKEGLWRAVIEEGYRDTVQLERALEGASAPADPLERLKQFLRSFAMINLRRPSVHAIMQKEVMFASARLDWLVDNYMQRVNQRLSTLIEECIEAGIFRPFPVEQLCVMLTGVLVSYFLASELPERMYGRNLKDDAFAWDYFDNALDALFNGMLTRPGPATGQQKRRAR